MLWSALQAVDLIRKPATQRILHVRLEVLETSLDRSQLCAVHIELGSPLFCDCLFLIGCHRPYANYHDAVHNSDAESQKKILRQYPAIGALHADFGELRETAPYKNGKALSAWYKLRKHLFEEASTVRVVVDPSTIKADFRCAVLEIQLTQDVQAVKDEVTKMMDLIYQTRFHALLHGAMPKHPQPKYQLCSGEGVLSAATIRTVKKASYVDELKRDLEQALGVKISQTSLVYEIKKDIKNPFGCLTRGQKL